METSGPISGIARLAATLSPAPLQWQVGQVLRATVADTGIGRALLTIGNRQVSAETSLALQKGEQLMLEVRALGDRPVLRLVAATAQPSIASAIRQLLPRQGALPPLLANVAQLARTPDAPVPPSINQLARALVKQIPDAAMASTAHGLQRAIKDSGIFLERQLYAMRGAPSAVDPASDFKGNLLRLVQLLRVWPASAPQTSAAPSNAPGPGGSTTPQPPATPAAPPRLEGPRSGTSGPAVLPAQLARAVQLGLTRVPPATAMAPIAGAQGPGGTVTASPVVTSGSLLPPPLPGAAPVPQSAVQASIDLWNRLGSLRTELLQQTEAALARIQLHQLAAVPREGDRGLLEWLLELPVRQGNDIDVWSLRIARDARQQAQKQDGRSAWTVQLAFDLAGLGPLRVRIRLAGEQISARFWAEQPATLPLLRNHLHELRRALADAGLDVGELDCQPGTPAADTPHSREPLISEKA